ncbi:MAG TPA: DUF3048 domain-containing protein [Clostridia bacterium]|jgi:hypothetical protein|nr:DUF3048 domain-containing protein [Clostridia bacterium]HQC67786.1 DUF3048 domain-containing protein [Clostridia bacterium]
MKHKRQIINSIKKAIVVALILILSVLFASCGDYIEAVGNIAESPVLPSKTPKPTEAPTEQPCETPEPTQTPVESIVPTETPAPTPDPSLILTNNPLTGKEQYMHEFSLTAKPVAVILENKRQSLPQIGISEADIVIEMLVEYDISRFMAIYQDPYKVERIGAVRSLRSYFTKMALAFDCYIFHYGFSDYGEENAKQDLIDRGLTTVNGIYGEDNGHPYWRDQDRIASGIESLHSVVTAGENVLASMKSLSSDKISKENRDNVFNFSAESSTKNGKEASKVYLTGAYISSPYFIYDQAKGEYTRYQFSDVQIDGNTNQPVTVENLFVLKMETRYTEDAAKHVLITTHGTGTGYYINDGKYIEIQWSRETDWSKFVFTANGEEIKVAPGNTWISCIPSDKYISIK